MDTMIMDVTLYNQAGEPAGEVTLPEAIFGVRPNRDLIHQALTVQLKNRRQSVAHAKDRSEVRGGGRKPWRQKGTGRARHGSTRSPLWRGGGITFGPTKERVFARRLPKQMRRAALRQVLSAKAAAGDLVVVERFPEAAKTKAYAALFTKLPVKSNRVLVMSADAQAPSRAVRNLARTKTIGVNSLNALDLLASATVVLPKDAIETIVALYGPKVKAPRISEGERSAPSGAGTSQASNTTSTKRKQPKRPAP